MGLPWGTWTANQLACLLDFALAALLLRGGSQLSEAAVHIVHAVILGVGGCLSTVSTGVVELQKQGLQAGHNHHALGYLVASLATSVLTGVVIVGTAAWVT